jgi:hypothetical protein
MLNSNNSSQIFWIPIILIAVLLSAGIGIYIITLKSAQTDKKVKIPTQNEATNTPTKQAEPEVSNPVTTSKMQNTTLESISWREINVENLWKMQIPSTWEIETEAIKRGILVISGIVENNQYTMYLFHPTFNPPPPKTLVEWVESETEKIPEKYKDKLIINQSTVDKRESVIIGMFPQNIKNEKGEDEYSDRMTITTYVWVSNPGEAPVKIILEGSETNWNEKQAETILKDFLSRISYFETTQAPQDKPTEEISN